MADEVTRGAARLAALIAVPIALVVGGLSFWALDRSNAGAATPDASASARPQSTAPVAMPAPALADGPATVCRALIAQLPNQIQTLSRRPVTAGTEQNAAYGDPAITVACDPGPQPSIPPTAELWGLSNVCWYEQTGKDATVWTTVDRQLPVRVTVPSGYDQPGQWVTEFSAPVAATQGATADTPSGCKDPAG
jgi:hypothetical protein